MLKNKRTVQLYCRHPFGSCSLMKNLIPRKKLTLVYKIIYIHYSTHISLFYPCFLCVYEINTKCSLQINLIYTLTNVYFFFRRHENNLFYPYDTFLLHIHSSCLLFYGKEKQKRKVPYCRVILRKSDV